jgi:DNA-binding MarR family transcriptional regulator
MRYQSLFPFLRTAYLLLPVLYTVLGVQPQLLYNNMMEENIKQPNVDANGDFETWGWLVRTTEYLIRARSIELAHHGLTREQSHVLKILFEAGGSLTLYELASVVRRAHNSASTIISRMEKIGLVAKVKVKNSRKYQVIITPKGLKLYHTMPFDSVNSVFSALSAEEKESLKELLMKLEKKTRSLLAVLQEPKITLKARGNHYPRI